MEEEHRKSLSESCSEKRSSPLDESLWESPQLHHSLSLNPEAVGDCPLSAGKREMIEMFRATMADIGRQTRPFPDRDSRKAIQSPWMPKAEDLDCSEIEEDSKESEEKASKTQENSPQPSSDPVSPRSKPEQSGSEAFSNFSSNSAIATPSEGSSQVQTPTGTPTNEISAAIQVLCKGIPVRKCCLGWLKVEECVICFSEDFTLLNVRTGRSEKVYSMGNFTAVQKGAKTENFKRYARFGIEEELCFTLIIPERSFDLVAPTQEYRDAILRHIRLLAACL